MRPMSYIDTTMFQEPIVKKRVKAANSHCSLWLDMKCHDKIKPNKLSSVYSKADWVAYLEPIFILEYTKGNLSSSSSQLICCIFDNQDKQKWMYNPTYVLHISCFNSNFTNVLTV